MSRITRALLAVALVVGGAACGGGAPAPSMTPSSTQTAPPPSEIATAAPSPTRSVSSEAAADPILSELHWYHATRTNDTNGNAWADLYVGRLDGWAYGDIRLVERAWPESHDTADPIAWTDPYADGIFGGRILLWGRDGHLTELEAVNAADAAITTLLDVGEPVQVATADATLTRVFYVTVDEGSLEPTGLWVDDLEDAEGPERLDFRFAAAPVSNLHKYRLIASDDGSHVAIQSEEGTVTVIDVEANESDQTRPGGPMLGFGDNALISLGRLSNEGWQVIAADLDTLESRTLAEGVESAQVVSGTDGDLLAIMRTDPREARRYTIEAVSIESGETGVVYEHDPSEIGPTLPRQDRDFFGAELPLDWALLADSFHLYIDGPEQAIKDRPLSAYPRLINLRTGEQIRVGLFVQGSPP